MNSHSLLKRLCYWAGFSIKRLRSPRKQRKLSGQRRDPALLRGVIHAIDPYADFDASPFPLDLQGWGGESPAFKALILEVRPSLVIEVGTWKGASAITMAEAARDAGLPTQVLCIDTWLGALEFWGDQADPDRYQGLKLKYGYPSVYYQFLANVVWRGLQDRIVPFPQTSSTAALWLRLQGFGAPLIYIDGSHEEEDVYSDLTDYWDLLDRGGILFGDDYGWDGVRMAANRFAGDVGGTIERLHDKWLIRKTEP
jgi:Methyltransferase domain